MQRLAVSGLTPPSTSRSIGLPSASIALRRAAILASWLSMKAWPPKPGLTLITSTRSRSPSTFSMAASGVAGLSTQPALLPRLLMSWIVRWTCGPASGWNEIVSAPASAKAGTSGSTGVTMRCTSNGCLLCLRSAFTTIGPIVRLGTKWPSITSTWIQSAPAAVDRLDLLAERGEIGRQDRGRDADGLLRHGDQGPQVPGRVGASQPLRRKGLAGKVPSSLNCLGEEAELLERQLQAALLGMALDLGIELRLLETRAGEIALELHDVDAVGGKAAQRLVERGRHALHAEQEGGHALHGAPVGRRPPRARTPACAWCCGRRPRCSCASTLRS